jgi:DNA polymerase/3'-5' exonuclease PolX
MSKGTAVPLDEATRVASAVKTALEPYCKRIVVAGSVRRQRPQVHDIDIVCEPRRPQSVQQIHETMKRMATVKLAGPKWIRGILVNSMPVDVFMVTPPAQWGVILAARTGPTQLWLKAKEKLQALGLTVDQGAVKRGNERPISVPDEETFFGLAGVEYAEPKDRELWEDWVEA